ncbi:uncharacterized protein TRAVEDRAFT_131642, partial [Trametes versicolor FP-101664 SS1]|uniref:uncharacterized protein n=1 Tax=Trametes versicolor (strain FP-101664) TaxID=717944 RepID=UPI0004622D87
LCRDVWPGGKGRLLKDTSTVATLPRHRLVPQSHDDLCEWLCVDPCDGEVDRICRGHIRGDDWNVERVSAVLLCRRGHVVTMFPSTPQGAPKALQTITLAGGRCDAVFEPQVEALANIREFVLKLLSRSDCNTFCGDGKIRLKRRVFERVSVRPTDDAGTALVIPKAEDPAGRANKIAHLWAVRHRIEAGVQREDGKIQRENPRVIRPGDFVDVAVTVQAIPMRINKTRWVVEVYFVPQTIIRLIPSEASIVRAFYSSADMRPITSFSRFYKRYKTPIVSRTLQRSRFPSSATSGSPSTLIRRLWRSRYEKVSPRVGRTTVAKMCSRGWVISPCPVHAASHAWPPSHHSKVSSWR